MIWTCLFALISLNLTTFTSFWYDKRRAQNGERRVRESDLLLLSAFGGTPAAFYARRLFRHKTRKEPFSTHLQLIAMIQAGLLGGLAIAFALSG